MNRYLMLTALLSVNVHGQCDRLLCEYSGNKETVIAARDFTPLEVRDGKLRRETDNVSPMVICMIATGSLLFPVT